MEAQPRAIRWDEPRWSVQAYVKPHLIRWGLWSLWSYARMLLLAGALLALSLYLVRRAGPGVPFQPGLIRALACGAIGVPLLLALQVGAFLLLPRSVSVQPRGVLVHSSSLYVYKAERINWATVRPIEGGRYTLAIEYRLKRGIEHRDIGLSEKIDPVELEAFLESLGWSAPPLANVRAGADAASSAAR